jgi:hypothetical protein
MILFGVPIRICPFIMFDGQVDVHSHSHSLCFLLPAACSLQHNILTFCLTDTFYVTCIRQDTM